MIVDHGNLHGSSLASGSGMGHGTGEINNPDSRLLQQQSRSMYRRAAIDAVAGAVAGAVARTVVSPLDLIKIRFQVQLEPTSKLVRPSGLSEASKYTGIIQAARDIVREEGIVGLWRGNTPALMLVMPYTAIQFVVLQSFKSYAAGSSKGGWPLHQPPGISSFQTEELPEDILKLDPSLSFIGGAIAGTAATIGSYPFDLLRTVLASQGEPKVYPNLRAAFKSIVQAKGWRGLYSGLTPSLVEIVPYAGLQFGIYDTLKHQVTLWKEKQGAPDDNVELSNLAHFFCGLTAGTISKTICHPLDVVKKRFQVVGLARDPRYGARIQEQSYKGMFDAMKRIVEAEGWAGLYKGTLPSVVKSAPSSATTFLVFEFVSSKLERWLDKDR